MNKYGYSGKLKAKQGKGEELAALLMRDVKEMEKIKGCQLYIIGRNSAEPDSVFITEVWDSKEDHQNSLKDERIRALINEAMPLLDGMPEKGQELEILGGAGIH